MSSMSTRWASAGEPHTIRPKKYDDGDRKKNKIELNIYIYLIDISIQALLINNNNTHQP